MTTLHESRLLTADEITAAVDECLVIDQAIIVSARRLHELKVAIRASMLAEHASIFSHPRADVTITPGAKVYDLDRVRARLGEKLMPDVMDKLTPSASRP